MHHEFFGLGVNFRPVGAIRRDSTTRNKRVQGARLVLTSIHTSGGILLLATKRDPRPIAALSTSSSLRLLHTCPAADTSLKRLPLTIVE